MRISDWSSDVCSSDLTCAGDLMNTQKGKAAPLWTPTPQRCADSNLAHYMAWLAQRGLCFADYAALQRWSTTELEAFWASVWEYFDVCSRTPYQSVIAHPRMPGARWFTGARVNFAAPLLARGNGDQIALYAASESGPQIGRASCRERVCQYV